jgi:four helix bundle protein
MCVRDAEVASSNLVAPIFGRRPKIEQENCREEKGEPRDEELAARRRIAASPPAVSFLLSPFLLGAPVAFAFEKLQVYQKAITFADSICTLTRDLPRGDFFLADQLSRASLSIAANIAEGNGRFTRADRRNFFGIARGSVQECVPLLELARASETLDRRAARAIKGRPRRNSPHALRTTWPTTGVIHVAICARSCL